MKKIKDYILVKAMFESRDYKNLNDSSFVVMSISEIGCDDYIKVTAIRGVGMSAKKKSEDIPMASICTKEMVRSMAANFKFDLETFIK